MERKIIVRRESGMVLAPLTNPASPEDVAYGKQYYNENGEMQTGTGVLAGITVAVDNLTTEIHPATITEGQVSSVTDEMALFADASFTVECDFPCVVAWTDDDGETYHRMYGENVGENAYKFTLPNEARKSGVTVTVGIKGDPILDGEADSTDAMQIQIYIHGGREFTPLQVLLADVNADGVVDQTDFELVLRAASLLLDYGWDVNV